MAESPNTLRPAARSDSGAYRPLSGLAVGALLVAGLGALVIIVLGVAAQLSSKPVLFPSVLLLPLAGLILALAARRQIRRAEGTRVGIGLAGAALWVSVLFGSGYAAYYFATEFAIRQQARAAADEYFAVLISNQIEKAFRLTLPPAQQQTIAEDDREGIRRRFGAQDLAVFERSDIPRVYRSWPDKTEMEYRGVQSWDVQPTGFQVELDYRMRNPEGLFGVGITLMGIDDPASGGRQWQVLFARSGFARERQTTKLGRLYLDLQYESTRFLQTWGKKLAAGEVSTKDLLRVNGQPPEAARREQLEAQLKLPGSLVPFPGSALKPAGLPTVYATNDRLDLVHSVEIRLPALGDSIIGTLTVRASGRELLGEVQRLQGLDWQQQPLIEGTDDVPELSRFKYELNVAEINALPGTARMAPRSISDRDGP